MRTSHRADMVKYGHDNARQCRCFTRRGYLHNQAAIHIYRAGKKFPAGFFFDGDGLPR